MQPNLIKGVNGGERDRAVSPVIGVILMVAITVILAAVIGTFVLELGQGAGEKAPDASVEFSDDGQPYDTATDGDRLFRIRVSGLSERVTIADVQLRIIEPDGTTATFFGQDATKAWHLGDDEAVALSRPGHLNVTVNGDTSYTASTELSSGDTIIVRQTHAGSDALSDDTDYTLQLVFTGGEDPKVIAEAEVRLK